MKSESRPFVTVIVIFFIVAAGWGLYSMVKKWHQEQLALTHQQAQSECLEVIQKLEADLEEVRGQLEEQEQPNQDEDLFNTVFGTESSDKTGGDDAVDCDAIEAQLASFFNYLDNHHDLDDVEGGSAGLFRDVVARLLANPPVNIGEMQEMFRLVKNVTHFYRVLGKERLLQAKEIVDSETRVMEPALALLYAWVVHCKEPLPGDEAPPSLDRVYDYAGYFLNTLGGRSYLLRRESKLRMLITYYSILIVDQANDEKFNRYGIDLRPYIEYLFYDIANQKGLAHRERYLTSLTTLRDKYL